MALVEPPPDLQTTLLTPRSNPVVTQTITRPSTTITAIVTLGRGSTTSSSSSTPTPTPTTTTAVAVAAAYHSHHLTGPQIGAIVGSILGFFAFLLLGWCFFFSAARRLRSRGSSTDEEETEDDEYTEITVQDMYRPVMAAPPVREGPKLVPPPPRIPPTPRYAPYRQTRHAQMSGVRRYP